MNTGDVYGEEVVQCYIGRPDHVPAVNQLVDFQRVGFQPSEEKEVVMHIDAGMLGYFDGETMDWVKLTGSRPVRVAASSRDIRMTKNIVVA